MLRVPLILIVAAMGTACVAPTDDDTVVPAPSTAPEVPDENRATYVGEIPCASCPGIQVELFLNPDRSYQRFDTYLEAEAGEDRTVGDMGRWALTADERMLILRGGTEGAQRFERFGRDTLLMLNNLGQQIESDLPYFLTRSSNPSDMQYSIRMSGMYRYMADAAVFTECRTGKLYPVPLEEDHISLERAYLATRAEPGEPLFATFDGRIEIRPAIEGGGTRPFVVVERFERLSPKESCHSLELELTGTTWKLIELNGYGCRPQGQPTGPNHRL